MALKDKVTIIESLREEYQGLLPMKEEYQQKLNQKFMLEWNYNSNHIEGNTLTYGETKLLLVLGQAPGNHEMRELEEMKAHNVAIEKVKQYAEDKERPLTEAMIRELNKIILVEPFWAPAETPQGEPTRKKIIPGQYKTTPNNVKTPTGETFFFASPEETPAKMNDLLQWYEDAIKKGHYDPWVAAELHYKLVRIHPFDDGNGRVARLLMNYHLLRTGYPPVIIKTYKKKEYLRALRQADAGDNDGLFDHVADEMIWSLEMGIRAGKGKDLEEDGDYKKEITILSRKVSGQPPTKSPKLIYQVYKYLDNEFWPEVDNILDDYKQLFSDSNTEYSLNHLDEKLERRSIMDIAKPLITPHNQRKIFGHNIYETDVKLLVWRRTLYGLRGSDQDTEYRISLFASFDLKSYEVSIRVNAEDSFEKSFRYDVKPSEEDTLDATKKTRQLLLTEIKGSIE